MYRENDCGLSYKLGYKASTMEIITRLWNVSFLLFRKLISPFTFLTRCHRWHRDILKSVRRPSTNVTTPVASRYFDSHGFSGHWISVLHWSASKISWDLRKKILTESIRCTIHFRNCTTFRNSVTMLFYDRFLCRENTVPSAIVLFCSAKIFHDKCGYCRACLF